MRYAPREHARMVSELGVKFNSGGWPEDIPFKDLNRIPNGTAPLAKLLDLVNKGRLKLVRATQEDKWAAERDPQSVIPNAIKRDAVPAAPDTPASKNLVHCITDFAPRFEPPPASRSLPTGTVYLPVTMTPQFLFPAIPTTSADAPDTSVVSDRPRRHRAQRSDINKSRRRPVTNPEGHKLRHPKRGPITAKYVVEAPGIEPEEVGRAIKLRRIMFADENLDDCRELSSEVETCGERGEPLSEIESASEWDREANA